MQREDEGFQKSNYDNVPPLFATTAALYREDGTPDFRDTYGVIDFRLDRSGLQRSEELMHDSPAACDPTSYCARFVRIGCLTAEKDCAFRRHGQRLLRG
jgi:hypothetical protein